MLISLTRALLMLLLLVAVPVQGVAALQMGICRAMHDGDPSSQQAGYGHVDALSAHVSDSHAHELHHASYGDSANFGSDADSKASDSHCAACPACGAAAGISAASIALVADAPADRIVDRLRSPLTGFTPDGLDRPPLTLLV